MVAIDESDAMCGAQGETNTLLIGGWVAFGNGTTRVVATDVLNPF